MSHYMRQETHLRIRLHILDYSNTLHRRTPYEPLRVQWELHINTYTYVCQVEVVVTEMHLHKMCDYYVFRRISASCCWTSPVQSERLQ